MASGTIGSDFFAKYGSNSSLVDGRIKWSSTPNISANTSTVTLQCQVRRTDTYTTTGPWGVYIEVYKVDNNTSVSGLTPILQKTEQTSTITIDGSWETLKTYTVTVPHMSNGNQSLGVYLEMTGPNGTTLEGTTIYTNPTVGIKLDTIYKSATLTSATNFTDEENPKIIYSNPAGTGATLLQICIADTEGKTIYVPYRDVPKTGTSYTFNLTDAERKTLRQIVTTGSSKRVGFFLKYTIGGVTATSGLERTLKLVNHLPQISMNSLVDTNSKTVNLTGDNTTFIRYYSNAEFRIGVSARKEATVKSRYVKCGNKKIENVGIGTFEAVESGNFAYEVVDSRGNSSGVQTITRTLIPYVKPTCNLTAKATLLGDNTAGVEFTITGNVFNGSFGATTNAITIGYKYKIGNAEYGSLVTTGLTITKSGNTYKATGSIPMTFPYQSACTIQAICGDSLTTAYSAEIVTKAEPVFDWGNSDFNVNVPVHMKNIEVLRMNDSNDLVVSTEDGRIALRTLGTYDNTAEAILYPDGHLYVSGGLDIGGTATIGGVELGSQKLLHVDDGRFMNADQSIQLTGDKRLPLQHTGYIFHWYYYSNGLLAQHLQYTYAPKAMLDYNSLIVMPVVLATGEVGAKALTITDDGTTTTITGVNTNSSYSPNNKLVLRRIIGF